MLANANGSCHGGVRACLRARIQWRRLFAAAGVADPLPATAVTNLRLSAELTGQTVTSRVSRHFPIGAALQGADRADRMGGASPVAEAWLARYGDPW